MANFIIINRVSVKNINGSYRLHKDWLNNVDTGLSEWCSEWDLTIFTRQEAGLWNLGLMEYILQLFYMKDWQQLLITFKGVGEKKPKKTCKCYSTS